MILDRELLACLLEAKRNTYAAQDDDATADAPLLPGSKELEWRIGDCLYRDIYFGMDRFTGQETLYWRDTPVWAMSYSGGVMGEIARTEVRRIYAFLRDSLRRVSEDQPFRGPREFAEDALTYWMEARGGIDRFDGKEEIFQRGTLRYALVFAGGRIA